MCLVPPFRHSISTRSFFPHPWRDHTGCRPARLMGMAILDLRSCRKRSRGQAKLVCREVHRRRERACRRGAATLRRIRNLSLDPCPAIRKNSICKRHPRRVETRRIRTGTHPRTRVNMVAVGANHDNMRFFEVIDERVQVCERLATAYEIRALPYPMCRRRQISAFNEEDTNARNYVQRRVSGERTNPSCC